MHALLQQAYQSWAISGHLLLSLPTTTLPNRQVGRIPTARRCGTELQTPRGGAVEKEHTMSHF